ncbi:MAG: ABC transporter substrate-binding protein, partial [Chloroflexota bacterium]
MTQPLYRSAMVMLGLGITLVGAACGGASAPAGQTSSPAASSTQAQSPAGASSPAASQAAGGKPVHVTIGYFPSWIGGWSGVIIKKKDLWKKYLPAGSTVTWDKQLVGPPIVNAMLANKEQIGYLGDIPAFVATTKRSQADIRIVETNLYSPGQICSIMLVSPSAPNFANPQDAIKWLDGKTVAVAGRGSCGDHFVNVLVQRYNLKAKVIYQPPEVIKTSLQAKKIDAAQQFEPNVSQIVGLHHAKIAFTGASLGLHDASVIIMRKDFIDQHHDAALGWLKADIEAHQFMLKNPDETAKLVASELPGWTVGQVWTAMYGTFPARAKPSPVNVEFPLALDGNMRKLMAQDYAFLHAAKAISVDKPPAGAFDNQLIQEAAKEM